MERTTMSRRKIGLLAASAMAFVLTAVLGFAVLSGNTAADDNTGNDSRVKERAPIEQVQVNVGRSLPPQYFLYVKYGLPNGCAQPGGYTLKQDGATINVEVFVSK